VKESVEAAPGLPGAVQDLARTISAALSGTAGTDADVTMYAGNHEDPVTVAAVRVLGADVLAPAALCGAAHVVAPESVERACALYRPAPGSTPVTEWSHWGLCEALRRTTAAAASGTKPGGSADPPVGPPEHPADAGRAQPDAEWAHTLPWQRLTHHLAQLASLAVPSGTALHEAVARRPVDLARGFVRAVRRRDWVQAAGAGRWLALTPGVPPSLGLDNGLEFVARMGGHDARVALHVDAAMLIRETAGTARAARATRAAG
jgi:hypothetical protein